MEPQDISRLYWPASDLSGRCFLSPPPPLAEPNSSSHLSPSSTLQSCTHTNAFSSNLVHCETTTLNTHLNFQSLMYQMGGGPLHHQPLFSFIPTPTISPSSSSQLLYSIDHRDMFPHLNASIQASSSNLPPLCTQITPQTLPAHGLSNNIPYGSLPLHQHQTLGCPGSCFPSTTNLVVGSSDNRPLHLPNYKLNACVKDLRLRLGEIDRPVFRCTTCSSEFTNAQAFGGHMSSHTKKNKKRSAADASPARSCARRVLRRPSTKQRHRCRLPPPK